MTLVYDRPDFTAEQIAVIQHLLAERHSSLHSLKNATSDHRLRDGLSAQMRTVEEITRLLGEHL